MCSLTSETVQKTIEAHSSIKGLEEVEKLANDLISDLNLSFSKRRQLLQSVKSYHTRKLANKTSFAIRLEQKVRGFYSVLKHLDIEELLNNIENSLKDALKKSIGNQHELRAAIIYEIITGDT